MKFSVKNGKIIKTSKLNINIINQAYWFDFSVYSSLKVIGGKIFYVNYHIDRLFDSALKLDLGHGFNKDDIKIWLEKVVKKNKINDGFVRMFLLGDVDKNEKADLYIVAIGGLTFYPDKFYKEGVSVITYAGERHFPNIKSKDLLLSFVALRQAKKQGCLESLLVDKEGSIREGTRTNFYALKGDIIVMPPDEKVLEGITKKFLKEAIKDDFKIIKEDIKANDLGSYDGFFLTSTTMNVMPIRNINGIDCKINLDRIKKIQKLYKEYIKGF